MGHVTAKFHDLLAQIPQIGLEHHRETILENSRRNAASIQRTIREIAPKDGRALVVSAGPSLYRQGMLKTLANYGRFDGTVVATDGAYIQCLKAGIKPDWVITIDPHPTRIVRWFGDPDYGNSRQEDDYFERQDLDVLFRQNGVEKNAQNIDLVDRSPCRLVISTTSPSNVVARTSKMERFWFAPLVDNPLEDGLTRTICKETGAPALNTGGTVGTAAYIFAHQCLQASRIAIVGCDFGYPIDTPLKNTQEWNLTKGDPDLYPQFPERGYYTSPTYWWYRQNFLDLLEAADATVTNCSDAGLLYGERVKQMRLEEWLASC